MGIIEHEIAENGRPPSLREIGHAIGVQAVGTVQEHVSALIKKGFLHRDPGLSRGLRPSHHSASGLQVPILGQVPAGHPIEAIEDRQGALSISLAGPSAAGKSLKNAGSMTGVYALRVKGESMIGAGILDGDYVVVKQQDDARDGEIVVALVDGEATVKTLERRAGGKARLLPANPRFHPIDLGEGDTIQGKVIGVQRFYTGS